MGCAEMKTCICRRRHVEHLNLDGGGSTIAFAGPLPRAALKGRGGFPEKSSEPLDLALRTRDSR